LNAAANRKENCARYPRRFSAGTCGIVRFYDKISAGVLRINVAARDNHSISGYADLESVEGRTPLPAIAGMGVENSSSITYYDEKPPVISAGTSIRGIPVDGRSKFYIRLPGEPE